MGERFADIKSKYAEETLQEYCKGIVDDFELFCKVQDFKKSTIASFAFKCCDSPLCDQLIFLQEYLMVARQDSLDKTAPGTWVVTEKGFTSVKYSDGQLSANDVLATQPVLKEPLNESCLAAGRWALQEYL